MSTMRAADEQQGRNGQQALLGETNGRVLELDEGRVRARRVLRAPADAGEDVQWRLLAIRAVLEREGQALARRQDERLLDVLVEIDELKLSIARALSAFERGGDAARDS